MSADTHTAPTTALLRGLLGDFVNRWTTAGTPRRADVSRHGALTPRRRRLLADPPVPVPDLWAIDRDELRSVLEHCRF